MTVKIVSPDNLERFAQGADEKFAEASHTHSMATTTSAGFMSAEDKQNLDDLVEGGGTSNSSSRKIGEIVASTLPISDVGLHLLDGSAIQGGVYSDFINYIANLASNANYSSLFVTESAWQSSNTSYGVCGKFVYDSTANTVRLPKITGIVEGTTDVSALGSLIEAGLPNINLAESGAHTHTRGTMNITGNFNPMAEGSTTTSGAFYVIGSTQTGWGTSSGVDKDNCLVGFDASRNWTGETSSNGTHTHTPQNSIYGKATTVQPQTIKVLYYIVIAETVTGTTSANINSIVTKIQSFDSNYDQKVADFNSNYEEKAAEFDGSNYLPLSGGNLTGNLTVNNTAVSLNGHTHNYAGSNSAGGPANKLYGIYTGSGGQQGPGYFGTNAAGCLMSNVSVNNDSTYKNWLYMDNYNGTDVGGATAIGVSRTAARAFIMQSAAARSSWANTAELLSTANYSSYCVPKTGGTFSGAVKASSFQATSDIRKKFDLTEIKDIDLSSLKAFEYNLNGAKGRFTGLIAQEVEKVLPTAVKLDDEGFLSLDYNAIVAVLVNKVNQLEARISKLENK
jgi:hypothetical protein